MLESSRQNNSSSATDNRTLAAISPAQAKRFLCELANLSDDPESAERLEQKFGRFLPWTDPALQTFVLENVDSGEDTANAQLIDLSHQRLFDLRNALRSIWNAHGQKAKEWRIFLFSVDPTVSVQLLSIIGPPSPGPFQQAVMYLFKWAGKTRHCNNLDCSSPYFLASRRSQKYCSEDCALPAQQECKRSWWHQNGEKWRKSRAQKAGHKTKRLTRG